MFVVVRRLVRWWPAALMAGLLYGFSPFMVGQGLSHEFLVFAPIPPLVLGVLAEVLSRARWRAWRAGLVLGVLFGAQFLIASETFAMLVLFAVTGTALALCYPAVRARIGHLVRVGAWAAGTCAVIIAYPVYFFFAGPAHVVGSPHPIHELRLWHGDLLGAFLPTSLMRFAPPGLLRIGSQLVNGNLQENGTYLGLPLVLIAAGLGIAYRRRPVTLVASLLAVLSYLLSLGPRVFIARQSTAIPGPFALLAHIPVFQDIEPVRFSLFTALFVAVVLGTGLDQLRFATARGRTVSAAPVGRGPGRAVQAAAARPPRPGSGSGRRDSTDVPVPAAAGRAAGTTPSAGPPGAEPPRAGDRAGRAPAGRRRAVLAAVIAVVALLPLVPRWPYPARPVTPSFFTTSAVQRIPPGSVVVTFPYPRPRQQPGDGMAGRCIGPVPYPRRLALLRTGPGRAQRRDLPPASLPPGYRQGLQGRVLRPRAPPRTAACASAHPAEGHPRRHPALSHRRRTY